LLALAAGVLTGLCCLTRYSFGWLILPVLAFMMVFSGQRRWLLGTLGLVAFLVVIAPWMVRNYSLSGNCFGIAGYSVYAGTPFFSEFHLERSFEPDLGRIPVLRLFWGKLLANLHLILQNDLPRLAGSWLSAFFLAGLLVRFVHPSVTRLRYFLVASMALLTVMQALCQTQLSEESPELNSENLLVLLAPLVIIYGVALFCRLFDQIEMPFRELRYLGLGAFSLIICLPMVFTFLPPKPNPITYPPYYPPFLQLNAGWARENELTVSDMPWAMAWYGQRQCCWATTPADLITLNDFQKPVKALVLTPLTLNKIDSHSLLYGNTGSDQTWVTFFTQSFPYLARLKSSMSDPRNWPIQVSFGVRQENAPASFPLHYWQMGWPDLFVLTAEEHQPKTL